MATSGALVDGIYDFIYQVAAEKADLIDTGFWQMVANIFRVSHPMTDLHKVTAQRILNKVEAGYNPATTSTLPIPTGQQASCGVDLNPNFPKIWVLLDDYYSAGEILFRMREQACQGSCMDIQCVPGSLLQAKKQGEKGCEFAVKIAVKKELYFYATGSRKND